MPTLAETLETDTDILGALPARISQPDDDLPLVHTPKPFIAPPVMDTCKPVKLGAVKPYIVPQKPRRVPRAWWGWIVNPRKYYRKLRGIIKLIFAGAYFMLLLPAVLMWIAN